MKKFSFRNPLFFLLALTLLLLVAGLATSGAIPPALVVVPLFLVLLTVPGLNMTGAIKVRDGFEKIRTLKYTHSSATVTDTIYYLNGMILLAMNSALANVENVFICSGLIEYAKVEAQAWTGGQKIYWDPAASLFTNVRAVGCILAGYAAEARANPTTTGFVVLDPAMRAASNASHSLIASGLSAAEVDADASVVITVAGVLATDIVTATLSAAANAVYVTKAVCTADTITITLSGNGGAGTVVNYQVARAVI